MNKLIVIISMLCSVNAFGMNAEESHQATLQYRADIDIRSLNYCRTNVQFMISSAIKNGRFSINDTAPHLDCSISELRVIARELELQGYVVKVDKKGIYVSW